MMENVNLTMTRYHNSRNWAIYRGSELLAVTVYRKGAQSIIDFINTITQNHNTMKKKTTTKKIAAKRNLSAKNRQAVTKKIAVKQKKSESKTARECERQSSEPPAEVVLVECVATHVRYRATLGAKGTTLCTATRGDWRSDLHFEESLDELIHRGIYRLANTRAREMFRDFYSKRIAVEEESYPAPVTEWPVMEQYAKDMELLAEQQEQQQIGIQEKSHPEINKRAAVCQIILAGEVKPRPIPQDIKLLPGMKLVRAYQGKTIEVVVEESGFTYEGITYPTLTHVSWKVTPYRASGNTFFGLPVKHRSSAAIANSDETVTSC